MRKNSIPMLLNNTSRKGYRKMAREAGWRAAIGLRRTWRQKSLIRWRNSSKYIISFWEKKVRLLKKYQESSWSMIEPSTDLNLVTSAEYTSSDSKEAGWKSLLRNVNSRNLPPKKNCLVNAQKKTICWKITNKNTHSRTSSMVTFIKSSIISTKMMKICLMVLSKTRTSIHISKHQPNKILWRRTKRRKNRKRKMSKTCSTSLNTPT